MQKMTFEELERHELEKMKLNTCKACSELTSRINIARMLDRCMKSKISLPQSEKRRVFENVCKSKSC